MLGKYHKKERIPMRDFFKMVIVFFCFEFVECPFFGLGAGGEGVCGSESGDG